MNQRQPSPCEFVRQSNVSIVTPLTSKKFHQLTSMLGTDQENLGDVISEGRYCDLKIFSRTHLSGKRL